MSKIQPLVEAGAREERTAALDRIEFRADDDSGELRFNGHAAVFDEWTEIPTLFGGSFQERIARGAFRKVLADGADVRFLGLNHNPDLVMARTGPGTMRLKEDTKGLRVDADLDPRDPDVQSLQVKLERGDVSQMSFGFSVGKHEIEEDEETGEVKRTITEFSALYDVSPVTFPAYDSTDASLRSLGIVGADGEIDEQRLLDFALTIFRGEKPATQTELAAIDGAFSKTDIVSPWTAERAARAYAREPELRAALQGNGVTMQVDGLVPSPQEPPMGGGRSAAAARAWLDVLVA